MAGASPLSPASERTLSRLRSALAGRTPRRADLEGFRPSAVLVPIVEQAGEPALLLTLRTSTLSSHAGQISFPGGRRDPGDLDLRATALRETEEELGLLRSQIEILGSLDDVPTFRSGYIITPFVGWLTGELALKPNPREVASTFFTPLEALTRPGVACDHGVVGTGALRTVMIGYQWEDQLIWGATARIIRDLLSLTTAPQPD
jgi:8-oxo-dGTP pyrophosphatase MutT (NUDIX family)